MKHPSSVTVNKRENMNPIIYKSAENKTEELARCYLETHEAPHRYLAYRDIPKFIHQFVNGKKVLDYGSGTGSSTSFLYHLGLDVIGIDISLSMLEAARITLPNIRFYNVKDLMPNANFDLVFSCFVLLELSSREKIIQYLNSCSSFLRKGGIFIGITANEYLYGPCREWVSFNGRFEENQNLRSGDTVRIALKNPEMEFYDYYWNELDYLNCLLETNLEILKIHYPLGCLKDPYLWKDELNYSPFTIFIAKKNS